MGWLEYWDDKPTVYVSQKHREAHARSVAEGLIACFDGDVPVVLDYGCGEALEASRIAARCGHLYLCDAAASVRRGLEQRTRGSARITVLAPDGVDRLGEGSIDLMVVNSVIQYLGPEELDRLLATAARLIGRRGRLLIADVIPRQVGPLTDAQALLMFAREHGFMVEAAAGLVRTFFSSYRKVRAELGLRQLDESEMKALLAEKGLEARRIRPNLGHNQSRMAFVATRTVDAEARGHD